ncbi:beta-lactamase family protein [Reinekea forsetii]|nr:beta-lactamase family protein [Reinekea forsetii]
MLTAIVLVLNTLLFTIYLFIRIPKLNLSQDLSIEDKMTAIDHWLTNVYKVGKFNGAVLLAQKGEVLFHKPFGYSDESESTLLNERSSFNLASVSKQFTAMGILILEHRGQLSLEDPLANHIPELSFYSGITIRHLLNHTSGLPDYMRVVSSFYKEEKLITTDKVLAAFQSQKPSSQFEPGAKFAYSNTGYVVLAEIIHRVSGQSFPDFMSEAVFLPLNMRDSQIFNLLSAQEPEFRVFGYGKKHGLFGGAKQSKDLNEMDGVYGDGSVYSSASDLALWDKALYQGTLLPLDKIQQAFEPTQLNSGKLSRYGFGWVIDPQRQSVEHAGGWQGFSSFIYRDLTNESLIVILDNSSNALRVPAFGFLFNSIAKNLKKAMTTA